MPGTGVGISPYLNTPFSFGRYWAARFTTDTQILYPNSDTQLQSDHPDTNYETSTTLNIGKIGANITRSLFDFNFIDKPESIVGFKLRLYLKGEVATNSPLLRVYKASRAWTEAGCTWNTYDGVNAWTSAGGDYDTLIGSLNLSADVTPGWIEIDLDINSPDDIQHGILIKTETENADLVYFASREATEKPELVITYNKIPLFTESSENPLFAGHYGSVVYDDGGLVFYYTNYTNVYKRTSTDGINWSDAVQVMTPEAAGDEQIHVVSAWKEGDTWYMLYRSNEWAGHGGVDEVRSIGLATSADGDTWVKSVSNPVITADDVGAWITNAVDPWGIIKIGSTYYLWINNVNEPGYRQTGLCTSTDLVNWTMDAENPIFMDGASGYCAGIIKRGIYYYLFLCYNSTTMRLYRDTSPRFLPATREYMGIIYESVAGTWSEQYVDTPSIITKTIERDTYRNNKIEMYMCNLGDDGSWYQGLAWQYLNILDYYDEL